MTLLKFNFNSITEIMIFYILRAEQTFQLHSSEMVIIDIFVTLLRKVPACAA